ncbi:MAG: ABC transporter permease [Ruminococcaceae bacterium]|nr:ABC transporter permease [Oscillospiraceae bacterium]
MRNAKIVFGFELRSILNKKSFTIVTVVISVIIIVATFIPKLSSLFSNDSKTQYAGTAEELEKSEFENTGYLIESGDYSDFRLIDNFTQEFYDYAELEKEILNGKLNFGVVFKGINSFEVISNGIDMSKVSAFIESELLDYNRTGFFKKHDINMELKDEVYGIEINSTQTDLKRNSSGNFIFAILYAALMYTLIILYGSTVSSSVAREKDNRTMEILIANTSSDSLIIGKTLAAGLAGIIQTVIFILSFVIGLIINYTELSEKLGTLSLDIGTASIAVTAFYAVSGYLLYLFIFAALGALVSKIEDVNYAITPAMIFIILSYSMAQIGLFSPENVIFKISSYFPFTSMLTMPVRYLMVKVGVLELMFSAVIMVLSIVFVSFLAIKIYRLGSLNYGNRMKFFEAIRMVKKGEVD